MSYEKAKKKFMEDPVHEALLNCLVEADRAAKTHGPAVGFGVMLEFIRREICKVQQKYMEQEKGENENVQADES